MLPVDVIAVGALSALGAGRNAYAVGNAGEEPLTAIAEDYLFIAAGLRRPISARVSFDQPAPDALVDAGRAQKLLAAAVKELTSELDSVLPDWRRWRTAVAIGSSSGDMDSQLAAFSTLASEESVPALLAAQVPYFAPVSVVQELLGIEPVFVSQVLAACASSTIAIGLGCRWLERKRADLVIAGGYDALSIFVAAGFEALGATTASRPAPFRRDRDGMAMGEGAALLALCRHDPTRRRGIGKILGFGASSDGVHITAPDRTGAGLARAARAALEDAGMTGNDIHLVSAHATATPFNDAAESKALQIALGPAAHPVVHPFKAIIGHTLGAAGALESLAVLDAIEHGVEPAAVGSGALDPELDVRLLNQNQKAEPQAALKLSAAFGGANAALVVGAAAHHDAAPRTVRTARVVAVGDAQTALEVAPLAERSGVDTLKLSRLDPVSELAVAACASVLSRCGRLLPENTGIVIGTLSATLEVNEVFDARRRRRGARAVEPRRFPATSPNLCCGECSIIFGLKGPALAVSAGFAAPLEAMLLATDLLENADADAMLVVAVDHVARVVRSIWTAAGWPAPERGAVAVLLAADGEGTSVDRERLAAMFHEATEQHGIAGRASAPGWPVLLEAVT